MDGPTALGLFSRLDNLAPEERLSVFLVVDKITQMIVNLVLLEICTQTDGRDLGCVKERQAIVRYGILHNLKKTFLRRFAAQTVRGLRHRHNLHLAILIVVFGIENAT